MTMGIGARIDAFCEGDPRAMGREQGRRLGARIREARGVLSELEAFRRPQPPWMPYPVYRRLAEWKAAGYCAAALKRDEPVLYERLAGLAEGAEVGVGTVALFNAMEPLMSSVGGCTSAVGGACTAIAVRGSRSADGEPVIARNFDYLPVVAPFYSLRESRPEGGLRSLDFTAAPLIGAVDGLNEAGLCVTYDYAFAADEPPAPAPSISMRIAQAIAGCRTVDEAAEFLMSRPRWGGAILMLADASGDIASLELSNTRAELRRPGPGEDLIMHTNAYVTALMRDVEMPGPTIWDDRAPAKLRGVRLHQSAERRDARLAELLAEPRPLSLDDLAETLADHGESGMPDGDTICTHGPYWSTTACFQYLPRSRRVRVAFEPACRASYAEFALD